MAETTYLTLQENLRLKLFISNTSSSQWLILTHGLGEHALRHKYLIDLLGDTYNICFYDLRGHGGSDGKRGEIDRFQDYIDDLHDVILYMQKDYKMQEYSLLGHSMGGLIVASYMKYKAAKSLYPKKVFFSSPAVSGGGAGKLIAPFSQKIHDLLASLPLHLRVKGMLDLKKLSHDPKVYEEYISDSKNTLAISLHLFLEILAQAKRTFSSQLNLTCESYVSIPMADVLVNPKCTQKFFKDIETGTKVLEVAGAYHELYGEAEPYKEPFIAFLKEAFL